MWVIPRQNTAVTLIDDVVLKNSEKSHTETLKVILLIEMNALCWHFWLLGVRATPTSTAPQQLPQELYPKKMVPKKQIEFPQGSSHTHTCTHTQLKPRWFTQESNSGIQVWYQRCMSLDKNMDRKGESNTKMLTTWKNVWFLEVIMLRGDSYKSCPESL